MDMLDWPSPLLLFAAFACVRLIPSKSKAVSRLGWSELGFAMLGGCFALVLSRWTSQFFLANGAVTASDFGEYCAGTMALVTGPIEGWSGNRSRLVGWIPALWADWLGGPIDGLQASALVSQWGIGVGLYLWGRALHSRGAGILAAILSASIAPLANMTHTLSFYPPMVMLLTISTGLCVAGARRDDGKGFLLGGLGVAIALLTDVRGLLWALPLGGALLLTAVLRRRGATLRVVAMLTPIVLSYYWSPLFFDATSRRLEAQANVQQFLAANGYANPYAPAAIVANEERMYLWGYSSVLDIPATLVRLREATAGLPSDWLLQPSLVDHARERIEPWTLLVLAAIVATILARARSWRHWLWVFATLLPFAASLKGAVEVQQSEPRFLAIAAPGVAVILGVSLAAVANLKGKRRNFGGMSLGVLLVLGILPSWLSPAASWRVPQMANGVAIGQHVAAAEGQSVRAPTSPQCVAGVFFELRAGGPSLVDLTVLRRAYVDRPSPDLYRPTGGGALVPFDSAPSRGGDSTAQ